MTQVCLICQRSFRNRASLGGHVKKHGMTAQLYYDKFIRSSEVEGLCKTCGGVTTFKGILVGYNTYCSRVCAGKDPEYCERVSVATTKRYRDNPNHRFETTKNLKKSRTAHSTIKEVLGESFNSQGAQLPKESEKLHVCQICSQRIPKLSSLGFHVVRNHHVSLMDYYDYFFKESGEGVCLTCSSPTEFQFSRFVFPSSLSGYREFCSRSCSSVHYQNQLEFREAHSKLMCARLADPNDVLGNRRGTWTKYRGVNMRSPWEVGYAMALDQSDILWKYENRRFINKGASKWLRYTPDFYLPELDLFIEIKPEYFVDDIVLEKAEYVRQCGEQIVIVTETNWEASLKIFDDMNRLSMFQIAG